MRVLFVSLALFVVLSDLAFSGQDLHTTYEKEAKKCTELSCIRREIDEINNEIITLLVKRTAYVQRAGDFKLHTKVANDQKRVDDQLQTIAKKSELVGLPKEIGIETFKAIIKNSIEFEQKYIDGLTR